ncbi:hypothetical protein L0222_31790 [bacterium]|nr:hypothetical protein [bacterium]MCI0603012.1 hypothetical protein [bacterium]
MKIFLAGLISQYVYSPGSVWYRMQFAIGLKRLGHDVYWMEEIGPDWCRSADGKVSPYSQSLHPERFRYTMEYFGLSENSCQIYNAGEDTCGLSMKTFRELSHDADLLINFSGHLKTDSLLRAFKRRVYVDVDPVYTQLWHSEYKADLKFELYDVFFTRGLNIGTQYCTIPVSGIPWQPILPPVVLDYWSENHQHPDCSGFTSVGSWTGNSDLQYRGEWYRSKYAEFPHYADLPASTGEQFEIVMRNWHPNSKEIHNLKQKGWNIIPGEEIGDLEKYKKFIERSRAEFGIAKHAYVKSNSAWFSERSTHYLASGKPVLAQSTGFERVLPAGEGLLSFQSFEEAVVGIKEINRNYEKHSRAARRLAEEYFDYRKVLPEFLEKSFQ